MDCSRPRPWLDSIATDPNSTGAPETSAQRDLNPVAEPEVGMEFESEDAAKEFYGEYARHAGFIMRIDQCRRSEVDKRILSRRLSCNKSGRSLRLRDSVKSSRKALPSKREGCKAMMLVKVNKSGKWVVTRFIKEHSHPLIASSGTHMDEKDMKIEELRMELEREDELCELYRGLLLQFLDNIEEQTELISKKIGGVVNVVTEFENRV